MSKADVVAVVLWIAATLYTVFGGADFGAGFWDLVAGGAERGRRPRALIDRVITPVWEANHVWLIFMLVVMWTGFPAAFGPLMTTLFVPLTLAALGIVLRGAGFAFRHTARDLDQQRRLGAIFAFASVLTPFFMGTVVGAIAAGRVHVGEAGDPVTSWLNITSITIGVLFVVAGAYVAAVFLSFEADRAGERELAEYFRLRALAAAAGGGVVAVLGLVVLHEHARFLYDDLTSDALPLVIVSVLCGLAAVALLLRRVWGWARVAAVAAVTTVVWGWGVAQYPYILPRSLTVNAAAAPSDTLVSLFVVFGAAVLIVAPSLFLLYSLQQRRYLGQGDE
jgi:cytochrome d ubiquinol oxidase subunit II